MFLTRLRVATAILAVAGILCAGSAVALRSGRAAEPAAGHPAAAEAPKTPPADGPGPWAWGKEVHGMKAGIRFSTRQTRFHLGDVIEFEVVARNVSGEQIHLYYLPPGAFLADVRPDGRILISPIYSGHGIPFVETVGPGKDWPVNPYRAKLQPRAPGPHEPYSGGPIPVEIRPGKYKVACTSLLFWPAENRENPRTGFLDLEILPAAGEKPAPPRPPANAPPDARR